MFQKKILDKLEFPKVLEFISKYCYTENGKEEVLTTLPKTDIDEIVKIGNYVTEAKNILIEHDAPPILFIPNLHNIISRSSIEHAVLTENQIHDVLKLAEVSRKLFHYLNQFEDCSIKKDFGGNLFVDKMFEHHIKSVFTDSGEIADNASVKLKEIRNDIRDKSAGLRKVVNKILKQLSESYLVQEEYITQRDGRIVIPIKAEHKRHIRGFIHSESATGHTVYIEPEETLELNNEILSLHFAERREVERILKSLTGIIGNAKNELKYSLNTISEIDAIFAKAHYSNEIIGSFPTIDNENALKVLDAKHPILLKKNGPKNTIPLTLKIEDQKVILITGPNAGGKTVVLKTLGLLVLMVQSGLHIPIQADSSFRIYNDVLIDIGDEQSIEDDLSTFSSHLSNINNILRSVDEKSLILLDEIGTGTDPAEGSALATAILVSLRDIGVTTLATTHHGNLKLIANDLEGFQNASMEFDLSQLKPTYIFQQGLPGSSYAFEVAERIGFNNEFIELSKKYLDVDKNKIEEFLVKLETKYRKYQNRLNSVELENTRLQGLTNVYQKRIEELEKQKKKILKEAKEKAELYLQDVNKQVESTIKNIRESNAAKDIIKEEKNKIEELKQRTKELIPEEIVDELPMDYKIKQGDYVKVMETNLEGSLIDFDQVKNKATIASGTVKLQVKYSNLIPLKKPKEKMGDYKNINFVSPIESKRLDIRGYKPEDADYKVIRYIDDAFASNQEQVEILHGKGTGILKKAVHTILKQNEHVKKFYFADIEFGGDGITIVELK
jgi:DNA mismatch repair protein MutS2